MLGKQAVIQLFTNFGIHDIFHLPGIHTLPFHSTIYTSNLRVFLGRHESNCIFMADGFARVRGKPGVVVVTAGPGIGNTVGAVMETYGSNIPLVILHVDTDRKKVSKGVLHGINAPESIFKNIAKASLVAGNKDSLVTLIGDAYRLSRSGRPGPVVVTFPYIYFEKDLAVPPMILSTQVDRDPAPDLTPLEMLLRNKKRPIIIGGRQLMVAQVAPLIEEICMKYSIPFFTTTSGKGTVDENLPFAFGNVMQKGAVRQIIQSSDIVIALGTRLRNIDVRLGSKTKDLVHIDIDDTWMDKNYIPRAGIVSPIREAVEGLGDIIQGKRFDWNLQELKKQHLAGYEKFTGQEGYQLTGAIRRGIPDEAITVWDLSFLGYWAEYCFPVRNCGSFLIPKGASSLFYALPAAIGAKVGQPGLPCLAVSGDGSILPTIGELATIKQYGIPVVLLVYNNNSYGILEDSMNTAYGIRNSMSLSNPDFIAVANSFGIRAKKVRNPEGLTNVLLKELTWDEPFLIEYQSSILSPPWK